MLIGGATPSSTRAPPGSLFVMAQPPALNVQFTIDSHDPHAQARWWARTLSWQVEPSDADLINSMISQGFASAEDTRIFDGALVWREGAAITPGADSTHPGYPGQQRILFQLVPEPKTVKNRTHLDVRLNPASGDKDEVRAELAARGASFLHEGHQGPHSWYTMADPEGNEFCIG